MRRLREARRPKLSQQKLAALLGLDYTTVSRLERGINPPSGLTLAAYEQEFGVPRKWILTGRGPTQLAATPPQEETTDPPAIRRIPVYRESGHGGTTMQRDERLVQIGKRLRKLRGRMTQKALADKLRTDYTTVGRLERGENAPSDLTLLGYEHELGATRDWILTGRGPTKLAAPLEEATDTEPIRRMPVYGESGHEGTTMHADNGMPTGRATESLEVPAEFLPKNGQLYGVWLNVDRMSPGFAPGNIILHSPAEAYQPGDCCRVVFRDGTGQFWQVFYEGDMVRLHPYNSACAERVVGKGDVCAVHPMVAQVRRCRR